VELKSSDTMNITLVSGDMSIIAKDVVKSVVTILVSQVVTSTLQFHCYDNVDITIRFIILFPEQADLHVDIFLCGNNSRVTIFGMYALSQKNNLKITSRQIHCGQNCSSEIMMQGILSGLSRSIYEGTIRINEKACKTYALQNNKNILLSDKAAAISIPNIEVLNHDVQCFHGAAVGKFDEQQMQYMQSRGLNELMIYQLLIQALFQKILQGYENRELILQSIYEKI